MTTIQDKEIISSVRDILIGFMGLEEDQVMMAYNKFDIPANAEIFVALSYLSPSKAIANCSRFDGDSQEEIIETVVNEIVQIDLMSFGPKARQRKEEVIAAFQSTLSMQIQERDNINIGRLPGAMVNTSSLEETQYLNRFTMTVAVTGLSRIVKRPDFFSEFNGNFRTSEDSEPTDFTPAVTPT